jgi:hypothetical protein
MLRVRLRLRSQSHLLKIHTLITVTMQARQEIRIWYGLTQRHMRVRGRTVT